MDAVSSDPDPAAPSAAEPPRRASAPPTPRPPSKPPRSAMTLRDMLGAIGVLLLVALLVAGVSRACTFSPGGPTVDPTGLPVVDAPAELRALAPRVPVPVRIPAVPPGWRSNSVDQDLVQGGGRAIRTGYITPAGRYLRLLQSDASEAALLAVETGAEVVAARGAIEVGGQTWVDYGRPPGSSGRDESIWIADLTADGTAPVRLLITGSGGEDDFRALAGAVQTGELLPTGAAPG
jgi:hypothetical protein